MSALQTEFSFTLPKGFVDAEGSVHRNGTMRLATARDEIEPLRDKRVKENEPYLTIIILSRVITQLGTLTHINPSVIEDLFASDMEYLQEMYGVVNFGDAETLEALTDQGPFERAEVEEMPIGVA
ncbi:MAG: hypothetical protein AB8G26_12695 [Ilumatobacter sp.]